MQLKQLDLPGGGLLTVYLRDCVETMPLAMERPLVLVVPGGGYSHLSAREGDPVALQFAAAGYHTAVLRYAVGDDAAHGLPLRQLAAAIGLVRQHAAAWHVQPDKIAVCGFSAGGHLAAGTAILWDAGPVQAALGADAGQNRPDAVVLSYPVVTSGPYGHQGSFDCIAGGDAALRRQFSLENQVRPGLPPFFIWHTVTDGTVPVENSMLLAAALRKNQVPFELHLMADGRHGMSLCTAEVHDPHPHNAHWFALCREWLDDVFGYRAGADGDPDQPFFRHGGAKG